MALSKAEDLYRIANRLASKEEGFFEKKGPGAGNHATNRFIAELGNAVQRKFRYNYSEQAICGENSLAVDFYFPEESTIVEVALGLKNPSTEFEKDILKAVMARDLGNNVQHLVFIAKPGGEKKCRQPGRTAVKKWLKETHGISIEVKDLVPP